MGTGLGTLLLAAGCGVDLTEPYAPESALLSAELTIEAGAPHHLRFHGELNPGREATGARRGVGGEALSLLERSLEPMHRTSDGIRRYEADWAADPAGGVAGAPPFLQGVLTPPAVDGTGPFAGELAFGPCTPSPGLADPLVPQATLTLRITCDEEAGSPTHASWSLVARRADTGGVLLQLASSSPPPSPIHLPVDWLDEDAAAGVDLELTLTHLYGWSTPEQDYRTALRLRWIHRWSVSPARSEEANEEA